MLVFVEPYAKKGHTINFVPDEEAIRISWAAAGLRPKSDKLSYSDETALADFKTVHWADTVEVIITRMGMAMWIHQRRQVDHPCRVYGMEEWESANPEAWREQAKAALKSLGVLL